MKRREKEGLSPVIATVLLISIVVATGLIIFIWARGFVKEEGTKFGTNIKLVCEQVKFEASYSSPTLQIINSGNVPIYRIKLKMFSSGSYNTKEISETEGWSQFGLRQGETFSGDVSINSGTTKILLVPVLLGNSGSGQKTYICEDKYGYEIDL